MREPLHTPRTWQAAALLLIAASCSLPEVTFDPPGQDGGAGQPAGGAAGESAGGAAGESSGGAAGQTQDGAVCVSSTSYRDAVMSDAPIGYWRLGEDFKDSSGHGQDLAVEGTVAEEAPGALACDSDSAVRFMRSGWLTRSKTPSLEPKNAFSFELWMQQNGSPVVYEKPIWYGNANGPPYGSWGFERWNTQSASTFSFFLNLNGTAPHVHSSAFTEQDRWYHVVGTYDGVKMRLYVDGQLDGELGAPEVNGGTIDYTPDSYGFTIGACYGGCSLMSGVVDEVAIYDKALSADRIAVHYAAAAH